MTKITPDEFDLISQYIYDLSGISLDKSKGYLVETRLGGLLTEQGCSTYRELRDKAKADPEKILEKKIIDAITTNETLFFRDISPFELLQHKIMPDVIDNRSGQPSSLLPITLRLWSAACSTGQELYSIAMVLNELLAGKNKYKVRLLGTDISDAAITQASCGSYNKFEVERGLSQERLGKYFVANGNVWKIRDEIRAMVTFRKLNLMLPFSGLGKFDIVFCRNVAIYFSLEDRKKLFDKIADILEPDGYLVIGSTESLTGICSRFEPKRHLRSIFYQLKA